MKPSLELASKLQNTMIVVSAAILILAYSPQSTEKYENAIRALRLLPQLSADSYSKLEKLSIDLNETIRKSEQDFFKQSYLVEDSISLAVLDINPYQRSPILSAPQSVKLKDIIPFLRDLQQTQRRYPDSKWLSDTISSILSSNPSYTLIELKYERMMKDYLKRVEFWKQHKNTLFPATPPPPPPPPPFDLDDGLPNFNFKTFPIDPLIAKIQSDIREQASDNRNRSLLSFYDHFYNEDRVWETINAGWDEISDLTTQEAIRNITKSVQESRKFSLLGLSIDGTLALIVGPVFLLFILLYYYFVLTHISHNFENDRETIALYPMPFSFSGWFGIAAPIMLCLIIMFSSISLTSRALTREELFLDESGAISFINTLITISHLIICILSLRVSFSIRKRISFSRL